MQSLCSTFLHVHETALERDSKQPQTRRHKRDKQFIFILVSLGKMTGKIVVALINFKHKRNHVIDFQLSRRYPDIFYFCPHLDHSSNFFSCCFGTNEKAVGGLSISISHSQFYIILRNL